MSNIRTNEWQVRRSVLSDGSVAWNVVGEGSDGETITIGAADEARAHEIADSLNVGAAWVDVVPDAGDDDEPAETYAKPVELYDAEDAADQLALRREAMGDRPVDDAEDFA